MGTRPQPNISAIPRFNLLLAITALRRFILVKYPDENTRLSPMRQQASNCRQKRICMVWEYEPISLLLSPFEEELRTD